MRDYSAELNQALERFTPAGDYIASSLAAQFVDYLQETDPDLIRGWLETCAVVLVTQYISDRRRFRASFAAKQAPRNAFAEAAGRFDTARREQRDGVPAGTYGGSTAPLSVFAERLVINEKNVSRPIGQMTREDHMYVAGQHHMRAKAALFEKAFHEAIAERIPKGGVTSDVLTEEQYFKIRATMAAI